MIPLAPSSVVDLSDPNRDSTDDHSDYLAELRPNQPVAWLESPCYPAAGYWLVTRHADVVAVSKDAERFRSDGGNVMDSALAGGDSGAGKMLAVTDGPRHAAIRKAVHPHFATEALETLKSRIMERTRALVAAAAREGSVDFADVAAQIPLAAICELLGIPETDHGLILRCTSEALSSTHSDASAATRKTAQTELLFYLVDLVNTKRRDLADDLLSSLAGLSDEEAALNCYSIILGGDETARLSLIGIVHLFATDEETWRALEPTEAFVEEVFRWTTPATHFARTVGADCELAGQRLRQGDVLVASITSANRDEDVFAEPFTFDPARRPNRHLTFAHGPHYCIGAQLARIEMMSLLRALDEHVAGVELDGDPEPLYSNFLAGYASLPVRITPKQKRRFAAAVQRIRTFA